MTVATCPTLTPASWWDGNPNTTEWHDELRVGVGAWLWDRFNSLKVPNFVKFGPLWSLGDSAPLIVTGLDDITSTYEEAADRPNRRTYTEVDTRLILADFFARLQLHA